MTDIMVIDPDELEATRGDRDFLAEVGRIRTRVEGILETCPENRLEVRRLFTRDLAVDPTPDELRTIGGVASRFAESGAVRDLAGSGLTAWVLARRELQALFEGKVLEPEVIDRSPGWIRGLINLVGSAADKIRSRSAPLSPDDRTLLLQLGKMVNSVREPLVAASVLAPCLERMARTARGEKLRAAFPSITDEEASLFAAPGADGTDDEPSRRACIAAIALRTIIQDDLSAWNTMPEDDPDGGARAELRARLDRDRLAYQVVSERVQQQQDAALAADRRSISEQLRRVRKGLFSAYLELAPILKATAATPGGSADTTEDGTPGVGIEELIEESVATDREAGARLSDKVSADDLYLNALEEMRDGKTSAREVRNVRRADRRREKLRIGVLGAIAAALVVACVFAYGSMLRTKPTSLRVTVSDLPDKLALTNAMTVGPMMYAQVSHHSWDHLTPQERIARVNELGLNLMERGIRTVYLTDESNVQVAIWTDSTGTTLAGTRRAPGTPG